MQNQVNGQFLKRIRPKDATKSLVIMALLVALGVICSMPFPTGLMIRVGTSLKFSLSYLVIALAARKYGIISSAIVAGMIDIMQSLISNVGPINPIILSANILTGVLFGIFLHKKVSSLRIFLVVLITSVVCTMIITTMGIVLMYSTPLFPLIWFRLLQTVIMGIIEFITLYFLFVKTDILKRIKFID